MKNSATKLFIYRLQLKAITVVIKTVGSEYIKVRLLNKVIEQL